MPVDARRRPPEPTPVTAVYLERAALAYLARYASSAANLRAVLLRKAWRRGGAAPDDAVTALVDLTVDKALRSGLVDDRSYAGAKLASLVRRGASTRSARAALDAKGLAAETVAAALDAAEVDEAAQARRFAERRRLGPYRTRPDPERRERDLAALCRAGFSYRVAVAALDGDGAPQNRK